MRSARASKVLCEEERFYVFLVCGVQVHIVADYRYCAVAVVIFWFHSDQSNSAVSIAKERVVQYSGGII